MKINILSFLLLGFSVCSNAQKTITDSWVELNNGDTLYGRISEKEWNTNPQRISFILDKTVVYEISDLKSFGVQGGDIYRRYMVTRHLIPYNDDAAYPEDDNQIDSGIVWLKILVKADYTLAALYQKERVYFYVIDRSGNAEELIAGRGLKSFNADKYQNDSRFGKTIEVDITTYKDQLSAMFAGTGKKINTDVLSYSESGLVPFFKKSSKASQVYGSSNSFSIGISGGMSGFASNSGSQTSSGQLFNSEFKTTFTPFLRVSFVFGSKKKTSKMSFIPELGISFFNTTGVNNSVAYNGTYEIKNTYAEAAFLLRYTFNPLSKHKIYLAAGINSYIQVSGENTFISNVYSNPVVPNVPEQKKFVVAPSGSIGYLYSQFSVFTNFQYLGEQTEYMQSTWTANRLSFGLGYFFKKRN